MTGYSYPFGDRFLLHRSSAIDLKAELEATALPFGFDLSNPGDMLMVTRIVQEVERAISASHLRP